MIRNARPTPVAPLAPALAFALAFGAAAPARAAEGPRPMPPLNEPFATSLVPSAQGLAYAPLGRGLGAWYGGGVEVVLFTWSNNADTFGPSQGKLRLDVGGLWPARDGQAAMVTYRGGAVVSFERNAGRSWLIPYFAADAGGMHGRTTGGRAYADAALGLYLLYTRNVMVDAEGAFVFPLTGFDRFAGPKGALTASVSLW
jgi:hypothetical protein